MCFTAEQCQLIDKIVQQRIREWKAEEAWDLRIKEQKELYEKKFKESDRQYQENILKSNRSFYRTFRLSILISSSVIAVLIFLAILY